MLKKKRKNQRQTRLQQQKQPIGNNQNNANSIATPAPAGVETKPVTVEDVAASTSQAEFETKKESLLKQLNGEIEHFEEKKNTAEAAASEAQKAFEEKRKIL